MKKVLVALLVAAMLLIPFGIVASAAEPCICEGHSHTICADKADCDCLYEPTATDKFIDAVKAYLGPRLADLIYRFALFLGLTIGIHLIFA